MPTPYVKKMAKKHHTTTKQSEGKWADAKKAAEKQGQGDNYAYVTKVYKSMMGEKGYTAVGELKGGGDVIDTLRFATHEFTHLRNTVSPSRMPEIRSNLRGVSVFFVPGSLLQEARLDTMVYAVEHDEDTDELNVVGQVSFEYPQAEFLRSLVTRRVVTPHAIVAPKYQRLALVSSIYRLALKAGYVFITEDHTTAASKLWDAMGKEFNGGLVFFDTKSQLVRPPEDDEPFQYECQRVLLGKRRTYKDIVPTGWEVSIE